MLYALIVSLVIVTLLLFLLIRTHLTKPDGLLNVDTRDPLKDYYDFVFITPTDDIKKKKILKIEVHLK